MMKKWLLISVTAAMLTGCGTLYVSEGITDEGQVDNIIFPQREDAWLQEGVFVNKDNLRSIKAGISKDDLYYLIGRPHFNEAQYAREWDYIFNFRQADDTVNVCQYKVIFDKAFKGQAFYWLPQDCANELDVPKLANVPAPLPVHRETVTLETDTLFTFDKWQTQYILPEGKASLDKLLAKINHYQLKASDIHLEIIGHTDRLGEAMYNFNLSQLRAETIRQYFIRHGIAPHQIVARGLGESFPVKTCQQNNRQGLIDCLQPNRRVEIQVVVYP